MGCHALLQGIFLTQGSNAHLCNSSFAGGFFTAEPLGKPSYNPYLHFILTRLRPKLTHLSKVTQLGNETADSTGDSLHHSPRTWTLPVLFLTVRFVYLSRLKVCRFQLQLLCHPPTSSWLCWFTSSLDLQIYFCLFVFNLFFSFHIWDQFSSVTQSCPTLCYPMECSTLGLPVHHQLLEFTQTHVHQVSDANQSSHSLSSSPSPPAFDLSQHQGFSNESALHIRWPKYWSFSFSISPSNEHSGLISFRMDWLDLLVVQETLKGLFQYHSSKASILQYSAFFRVQLSHPYLTTGKTIVLTIWSLLARWCLCFLVCCSDLS